MGRKFGEWRVLASATKTPAGATGAYCVAEAVFGASKLKANLWLPMAEWNGRLLFVGGGGFDGQLWDGGPGRIWSASALTEGYAIASTNGGYDWRNGARELDYFQAAFAREPQQFADFTHLAPHKSLQFSRAGVQAFYGSAPQRSYFEGCSMGGREALMEAQRWPADFDGVVARAPAGDIMGLFVQFSRIAQAVHKPGASLSPAQQGLLARAVLAKCDGLDGAADGLISRPDACRFDPETLGCPSGAAASDTCLSPVQVQTVRTVTSAVAAPGAAIKHPGYNWGGEDERKGWSEYVWPLPASIPGLGGRSTQDHFSTGFIRSFVTRDPAYDVYGWKPAAWTERLKSVARDFQAFDPDLRAFHAHGGRLILWNGEIDTSVSARDTVRYYAAASHVLGPASAGRTMELFLAPGVGHCFGGPGPDKVDLLRAARLWAETGAAPSSQHLVLEGATQAGAVLTRPMCPYPAYPRYRGGDVNRASSFSCARP